MKIPLLTLLLLSITFPLLAQSSVTVVMKPGTSATIFSTMSITLQLAERGSCPEAMEPQCPKVIDLSATDQGKTQQVRFAFLGPVAKSPIRTLFGHKFTITDYREDAGSKLINVTFYVE